MRESEGIQATSVYIRICNLIRKRMGCCEEHLVGDRSRLTYDDAQPKARENIGVVALSRYKSLITQLYWVEWAATRENGAAVAEGIGLFCSALCLRRGIR